MLEVEDMAVHWISRLISIGNPQSACCLRTVPKQRLSLNRNVKGHPTHDPIRKDLAPKKKVTQKSILLLMQMQVHLRLNQPKTAQWQRCRTAALKRDHHLPVR